MTTSAPAAPVPAPPAPPPARRTFAAFISYSHRADQALATALHGALHRFAKRWNQLRAVRIARDKATMDAGSNLWGTIVRHIDASEHLILLASPAAAQSPWVPREIEQFLRTRTADRIVLVVTDGEVAWDAAAGDFDWTRTTALPRMERPIFASEPRWVDLRGVRRTGQWSSRDPEFREAVAEISATIRGLSKDELVGQDVREHRRTRRLARTGVALLALLAVGMGLAALQAWRKTQESTRRLAGTYVASGVRLVEDGDPAAALPWFAAAWRLEQGDADRARMHRLRFAATLARTGRLERAWWADAPVWRGRFSPDGRRALVTTGDVPDEVKAELLRPVDGGHGPGDSIPDRGAVWVWDPATGRPDGAPLPHAGAVSVAAFSADGRAILTAGFDSTARLWDAATRRPLRTWRLPAIVRHAELTADGEQLLTVTAPDVALPDGSGWLVRDPVRVWPVRTEGPARVPRLSFRPYWARLSPDGRRVVIQNERALAVWDLDTDRTRELPLAGIAALGGVRWSPDGRLLAVPVAMGAGWRRSVALVDAATGQVRARTMEMEEWPQAIAFSPDGSRLVTAGGWQTEAGSGSGEARVWNTADGEPLTDWHHCGQSYTDAAFSPDGGWVATACDDGTVSVWPAGGAADPATGADTLALAESVLHTRGGVQALAFHPSGARLLTLSRDRGVRLWDLARRDLGPARPMVDFEGDAAGARLAGGETVEFVEVPDGPDTIVVRAAGGTVARRIVHAGDVRAVAAAPGGRIATVASDDSLRLWDARTGARTGFALLHPGIGAEGFHLQTRVRFSPDGGSLVTAAEDLGVRVWDARTGRPVTPLLWAGPPNPEMGEFRGAAFALDGTAVVAGVMSKGGRMWDARTGELLARLESGWTVDLLADGTPIASRDGPRGWPWRFAPYAGTVDEAVALAELLAHRRMDDGGGMVRLSGPELRARWRARAPPPR